MPPKLNQIHWPKLITEVRKAYGLTQAQLAQLLQVTGQTISNWESPWDRPRAVPGSYYAAVLLRLGQQSLHAQHRQRTQLRINEILQKTEADHAKRKAKDAAAKSVLAGVAIGMVLAAIFRDE
jgi:DNA-binding XRE family transcriptional regulator